MITTWNFVIYSFLLNATCVLFLRNHNSKFLKCKIMWIYNWSIFSTIFFHCFFVPWTTKTSSLTNIIQPERAVTPTHTTHSWKGKCRKKTPVRNKHLTFFALYTIENPSSPNWSLYEETEEFPAPVKQTSLVNQLQISIFLVLQDF